MSLFILYSICATYLTLSSTFGGPCFSVCGWLCGQIKKQKLKHHKKVRKAKEKPLKPEDLSGFLGAARQIRTADLILTNYFLRIFHFTGLLSAIVSFPCGAILPRLFCSVLLSACIGVSELIRGVRLVFVWVSICHPDR